MAQFQPQTLIGTWRRFGPLGPAYEVIDIGGSTANGEDWIVKIRLAETAEIVDYTLNRALDDECLASNNR